MGEKAALLNDPVIHYDGHTGIVISANDIVYENGIPVTRVDDDVLGHIGTGHEGICKIITGSSIIFIEGQAMALDKSQVSCAGEIQASAQVIYSE